MSWRSNTRDNPVTGYHPMANGAAIESAGFLRSFETEMLGMLERIMAGVMSALRGSTYRFADFVFGPSEVARLTLCIRSVDHRSDRVP